MDKKKSPNRPKNLRATERGVFDEKDAIADVKPDSPRLPAQQGGEVAGWREQIERLRARRQIDVATWLMTILVGGVVVGLVIDLHYQPTVAAANLFSRLITVCGPAFLWFFGSQAAGAVMRMLGKKS